MSKQGTVSVFKRLFLMFVGLVLVIYLILAGLFLGYVKQQREMEITALQTRVTSTAAAIEQQISATRNIQIQLGQDTRIARLAQGLYSDSYEKYQMILEVMTSIQHTQSINGIIDDIVILMPGFSYEISARNGYSKIEYDVQAYHDRHDELKGQSVYLNNGNLEMSIAYPLVNALDDTYVPDYEIRFIFSTDYLNDYIKNFRVHDVEGAFWTVDGSERILLVENTTKEQELLTQWEAALQRSSTPKDHRIAGEEGDNFFFSQRIGSTILTLVTYQDSRTIAWKLGNNLLIMGLIILALGMAVGLIVVWANNSVSKPIYRIMDAFSKVKKGELGVRIYHKQNDEFGYIYDSFNSAVGRIEELIENIKEQKLLLQSAEMIQLQSQINPHFLYNSFYNIKFLAHNEEYGQIVTLVTALAKYYRFLNKQTDQNIPLKDEVAHMNNYIEIQQMRFGDKITVENAPLPEQVATLKVPKLILQPIIENAYGYGLVTLLSDGKLWIRYGMEEDYLLITIEDNGSVMTPARLEKLIQQIHTYEGDAINHALTNIQRRLMLAYSEPCGVELAIGESGGLKVTLRLDTTVVLP